MALLHRVEDFLGRAGYGPRLVPTTGPETAGLLARQAIAEDADLILAAGGDGTINEVAEGMVHSSVPLGILPAGTANVLATEMGLGSRMERVAARLDGCHAERISVGRLTCDRGAARARHFLLMAGAGLDAHIVYHVNPRLKAFSGKLSYWVAGFSLLGHTLAEFQVEAGGQARTCSFALISRVRNYGGDLEIARSTSLFDDQFEIVLFEGSRSFRYLKYLGGVLLRRAAGLRGVSVLRTRKVSLSGPAGCPVHLQIDGEYAGLLPGSVELVPDALTLLIPPEYFRKHSREWAPQPVHQHP